MSTCTTIECRPYGEGFHHPNCRHLKDPELMAYLANLGHALAGQNDRIDRLKKEITAAQGRHAILRVENNALRKRNAHLVKMIDDLTGDTP